MSISQAIYTQEKKKDPWDTLQYGRKSLCIIYIYENRAIFLLFWDHQDTEPV